MVKPYIELYRDPTKKKVVLEVESMSKPARICLRLAGDGGGVLLEWAAQPRGNVIWRP